MSFDKILYTTKAHTTGGRDGGASQTDDGRLAVKLSSPGTGGAGTNPEQLFAAGWSACFLSAVKLVAGKKKIPLPADVAIDAEVDLGVTRGVFGLAARLNVSLPGVDPRNCPGARRRRAPGVPVLARDARQHRRRDLRGDTMTYQGIAERGALDSGCPSDAPARLPAAPGGEAGNRRLDCLDCR